jgi:light-regulated signal transduction histidine kinase (bacteriophytochrome)
MDEIPLHPPFGTADLTNCERELIHLPASIQPHGAILILHPTKLHVLQASLNAAAILGPWGRSPLGVSLDTLDPVLGERIRHLVEKDELTGPLPVIARVGHGESVRTLEGMVHRLPNEGIAVELEPSHGFPAGPVESPASFSRVLAAGIEAVSTAPNAQVLYQETVRVMKELTGYDRVMVYKFDRDGHGEIVGESKRDDLEPFLGLHYPSSDIPQRARELYLKNRVRVLVDVAYEPAGLFPRLSPITGGDVDMSMCYLRSMSPLHLQYLSNMGVRATLVASLTRGEHLWGLIACHHYSPRVIPYEVRAACGILAEMVSTRLSALENMALAQTEMLVRRLEQTIVEALATTGDWRTALFAAPKALLQAVDATGAALVHEGELLSTGEVPSSQDIRSISEWLAEQFPGQPLVVTSALPRVADQFAHLPSATGLLAITLSGRPRDYLVWFRREQVQTLRWAGDPRKPVDPDDPNQLSPRRSFAVWTEMTRGTSKPWTEPEMITARAIRTSLVDMVQQVQAVRVLIAQDQFQRVCQVIEVAPEPTVIVSSTGQLLVVNHSFRDLLGKVPISLSSVEDLMTLFGNSDEASAMFAMLRVDRRSWNGELTIRVQGQNPIPIAVRAEPVPGESGNDLGYVLFAADQRARHDVEATRRRVNDVLLEARRLSRETPLVDAATAQGFGEMIDAILSNARRALTDIAGGPGIAPPSAMASVEALTRRATALALQLEGYAAVRRRLGS